MNRMLESNVVVATEEGQEAGSLRGVVVEVQAPGRDAQCPTDVLCRDAV